MGRKPQSHRISTTDDIEVSTYLEIARELHGEQPAAELKPAPPGERETIVVVDFGSQYSLLIARRIRECHVYCEIVAHDTPWERIASLGPKGFVLSGGPKSVYEAGAPLAPTYIYEKHLPVMGICYGMHVIAHQLGGKVSPGEKREYGHAILHLGAQDCPLFAGLPPSLPVWMSHGDQVTEMPPRFESLAYTENSPFAAIGSENRIFGVQFHPEVAHTPQGREIFENFTRCVCGCRGDWTPTRFIDESVDKIQRQVGNGRVICALSGGCLLYTSDAADESRIV
ncbi:MAG: glutamine-hydrolyzing GMP synthase, partial [Chloroflexi bacterium]|nr:glutamine-hydrolyzing GMP synthase [Chloroflexota bacterium]